MLRSRSNRGSAQLAFGCLPGSAQGTMADYLIDQLAQQEIAEAIDAAVKDVLSEFPNHGSEEGLTPVLGHALMRQSFDLTDLRVDFNYRQLSKYTEENLIGADGGFLVCVHAPGKKVKKAALFQAKLLKGSDPVRRLKINSNKEANKLSEQCHGMLAQSRESVAMFYTESEIYIVDAMHYANAPSRTPLSTAHRLVTLGTYLGKWIPRCTKGDDSDELISRVERPGGFSKGIEMEVLSMRAPIPWKADRTETRWRR